MRIFREKDYDAMSRRAASIIAGETVHNPGCVLGLATGSTPEGAYKYLVDWYKQGLISFRGVLSVNLDEYVGLAPTTTRATAASCRATSSTTWISSRRIPGCPTG